MAILQSTGHTGPGLLDGGIVDANFAAVNIPSVTSAERQAIVAPEAGKVVYDTDLKSLCFSDGQRWHVLTATLEMTQRAGPPTKHD